MNANSQSHPEPNFDSVLEVSSTWLYRLVTSEDPAAVERLIARLYREYYLERPDRAQALLEQLKEMANDPLLQSLAYAPEDDEPLTAEDLEAIDEALDEVDRGDVISSDQIAQ